MDYLVKEFSLAAIANAIRKQSGSNESLRFPDEFIKAVENAERGSY